MSNYPSVFIIILTYNQKEKTLRCLASLAEIDYPNYSILLIDNGSTDQTTVSVKKKYPSVFIEYFNENLGVAGGRNKGAEIARQKTNPDYLLFLDNDTTVEKDFLNKLAEPLFDNSEIGITTPKIKFFSDHSILFGAGGCDVKFWRGKTSHVGYGEKDKGQYDNNTKCISSGGCMLVRSDIFFMLNGFDEKYNPYGPEDLDFSLRAKEQNYHCIYVHNSIIYHDQAPGRTIDRGKFTMEYVKRKLKQLSLFNNRHAPFFEKILFNSIFKHVILVKAFLKIFFRNRQV